MMRPLGSTPTLAVFAALSLASGASPRSVFATQTVEKNLCAVFDFRDLEATAATGWGRIAAETVREEVGKARRFGAVVPREAIEDAAKTFELRLPPESLVHVSRIAQDARTTRFVLGDVFGLRTERTRHGRRAVVAVRIVAYETSTGIAISGGMARGESSVGKDTSDADLSQEAIRSACVRATQKMLATEMPAATILDARILTATIDQGSRAGFKPGDKVILYRGPFAMSQSRVTKVSPDRSEIQAERNARYVPGSLVRRVYTPPALPLP